MIVAPTFCQITTGPKSDIGNDTIHLGYMFLRSLKDIPNNIIAG